MCKPHAYKESIDGRLQRLETMLMDVKKEIDGMRMDRVLDKAYSDLSRPAVVLPTPPPPEFVRPASRHGIRWPTPLEFQKAWLGMRGDYPECAVKYFSDLVEKQLDKL